MIIPASLLYERERYETETGYERQDRQLFQQQEDRERQTDRKEEVGCHTIQLQKKIFFFPSFIHCQSAKRTEEIDVESKGRKC